MSTFEHMERVCRAMHSDGLITLWGAFRNDLRRPPAGLRGRERQEFRERGIAYLEMIERILAEKGIPYEQLEPRLLVITEDR